jgi:tRNA dimethylallyltransferase
MKKVIAIVGPTAIGKTKISISIAKRFGFDIISADSVAVYKKLDIGSAKPTKDEMDGVKHYLIDVLEPNQQYNVEEFQNLARNIIDKSDKPVIIAGGTGLYVQSVLYNYEFDAPIRDTSFENKYKEMDNDELYKYLINKDPSIADRIHPNNRKRILRALEILESTGKSITEFNGSHEPYYDFYIIYLNVDNRDVLYKRINERVDKMFDDGLLTEVSNLNKKGIFPNAIGYKELVPYFNNEISLDTAKEEIKKNSRHLAKRQMTWFKNQMDTHFYNVNLNNIEETINLISSDIDKFLKD